MSWDVCVDDTRGVGVQAEGGAEQVWTQASADERYLNRKRLNTISHSRLSECRIILYLFSCPPHHTTFICSPMLLPNAVTPARPRLA